MFLFNQLLGLNLTTHINSIINSGNDDDDIIIYVAIGISVAAFLVVGCCRLVGPLFFKIYIVLYLCYIYIVFTLYYPQMMHIDKEQQNTSQATTATRSIENPVYTVSEELLVLYFQMTLK